MRVKFKLATAEYNAQTVTIVLNVAKRVVGMVVDTVSDVIELKDDDVKSPPAFSAAIDVDHLIGLDALVQGDNERLLILMDIEKLMSGADMGSCTANGTMNQRQPPGEGRGVNTTTSKPGLACGRDSAACFCCWLCCWFCCWFCSCCPSKH